MDSETKTIYPRRINKRFRSKLPEDDPKRQREQRLTRDNNNKDEDIGMNRNYMQKDVCRLYTKSNHFILGILAPAGCGAEIYVLRILRNLLHCNEAYFCCFVLIFIKLDSTASFSCSDIFVHHKRIPSQFLYSPNQSVQTEFMTHVNSTTVSLKGRARGVKRALLLARMLQCKGDRGRQFALPLHSTL